MQHLRKTTVALALAGVSFGAWAKAVTFEEIERADTVSGRYINHLSATEMDATEGSVASDRTTISLSGNANVSGRGGVQITLGTVVKLDAMPERERLQ